MKHQQVIEQLEQHDISPSAQRVAVANYVLQTEEHPSADEVWEKVKKRFPMISRATVYNTLNLFVEKGLIHQLDIVEGRTVFDPNVERHHHFLDEVSGKVYDIPWEKVRVSMLDKLTEYDVSEYQVVIKGTKRH